MSAQTPALPITLTNGLITLDLEPPDPVRGFYRGTRFDWSGMISRLMFAGHRFYAPWFARIADVRDYAWENGDVVAGVPSAGTGPAEEFSTNGGGLGYDDAMPGGTFIKIGVGVLRRPDDGPYSMFTNYPVVDHGRWTVSSTPDSATFAHVLTDPMSGYGYDYRKTVRLQSGAATMVLSHHLRNTGTRTIASRVYNHNFLVLDGLPTGGDFTITLPFAIRAIDNPDSALARVCGRQVAYRADLLPGQTVSTVIEGFGGDVADNRFVVEHAAAGVGMRVDGDRPLVRLNLWSIRPTLAVEPFIEFSVAPGEPFDWSSVYTYYTLSASRTVLP